MPARSRASIPGAGAEAGGTPLPKLSLLVLSITMLGEFLSASVATPFVLFMVQGFGKLHVEADVAYWTGILVSAFFITQFLTSLLWATVAEKYGQRVVLTISLSGSAITCALFGTSRSLEEAITIRLLQGVFAGAVGVARSTVTIITDPSNEGRAYAILGFCWGLGGMAGAIIGGTFESPANKWPNYFSSSSLLYRLPYLLPCMIAASITFVGAFISLFLARDGGPRDGAILLSPEKDDDEQLRTRWTPLRLLGFLRGARRHVLPSLHSRELPISEQVVSPADSSEYPLVVPPHSTASQRIAGRVTGSAYNFSRNPQESVSSRFPLGTSRGILGGRRNRRLSGAPAERDLNIAQRILIANEFTVSNMADLWVDAAITAGQPEVSLHAIEVEDESFGAIEQSDLQPLWSVRSLVNFGPRSSVEQPNDSSELQPFSTITQQALPAIYNNTGVRKYQARTITARDETDSGREEIINLSSLENVAAGSQCRDSRPAASLWAKLPISVILQYGFLALHSTTHDQVFLSYLVSPHESGGLGLNASHYAQLIALMCLAQIGYQFYLFPNLGPPRGRFSHLAMFRVGSGLLIPAYLTVILYRPFAGLAGGNLILMCLLALSTAIRYCGSTFAYTAVAILLNYMSPPEVNGLANGIAQSIVSLARFLGPILGGYLWSSSIENGTTGYPLGFIAVSGVACVAIMHSFVIR